MNEVYLYDGTYFSCLALITALLEERRKPSNIQNINTYNLSLLEEPIYREIKNPEEKIKKIKSYLSKSIQKSLYYLFLSDRKEKEIILYHFIKAALIYKDNVWSHRNIYSVNETIKIVKKVGGEAHKLKGFLRFKEFNNHVFYATISPKNNVLPILANHFQKRLKEEFWIIEDDIHKTYAIYDKKSVYYSSQEELKIALGEIKEEEIEMEKLWKLFHKTIAIHERENKKCQQNFMPKRYWKNMIEMEDEYEENYNRGRISREETTSN